MEQSSCESVKDESVKDEPAAIASHDNDIILHRGYCLTDVIQEINSFFPDELVVITEPSGKQTVDVLERVNVENARLITEPEGKHSYWTFENGGLILNVFTRESMEYIVDPNHNKLLLASKVVHDDAGSDSDDDGKSGSGGDDRKICCDGDCSCSECGTEDESEMSGFTSTSDHETTDKEITLRNNDDTGVVAIYDLDCRSSNALSTSTRLPGSNGLSVN